MRKFKKYSVWFAITPTGHKSRHPAYFMDYDPVDTKRALVVQGTSSKDIYKPDSNGEMRYVRPNIPLPVNPQVSYVVDSVYSIPVDSLQSSRHGEWKVPSEDYPVLDDVFERNKGKVDRGSNTVSKKYRK